MQMFPKSSKRAVLVSPETIAADLKRQEQQLRDQCRPSPLNTSVPTEDLENLINNVLKAIRIFKEEALKKYAGNPIKVKHINLFCQAAESSCTSLQKVPGEGLNDFYKKACSKILLIAEQNFPHDHKIRRLLLDCLFIPLGIFTVGLAFVIKKVATGSFTYSGAETNRTAMLREIVQVLLTPEKKDTTPFKP
jgi:hypothetical protein